MAHAPEAPATTPAEGPTSHTQNQLDALVERLEALLQDSRPHHGYTRAEQIAGLHRLREPFDPREVRYRPQPWCKNCSNAKGWPKVCERHSEIKCKRCNDQKITEAHICLKYIGHAEATNRLLNVDPFWDWEPLALDQVGLPQYDGNRGLWIRLTVCGVTRIGYGDADGKTGGNAVKEIIGDAIRNAGMRFGMALNLWTKSDLQILEPGVELAPELAAELGMPTASRSAGKDASAQSQGPQSAGTPSPSATSGTSAKDAPTADLARLTEQYRNCWGNAMALSQIRIEGQRLGLADARVQGPPAYGAAWTTFDALLQKRIDELNAAPGGDTERGAA
jgi:hypothetical protein